MTTAASLPTLPSPPNDETPSQRIDRLCAHVVDTWRTGRPRRQGEDPIHARSHAVTAITRPGIRRSDDLASEPVVLDIHTLTIGLLGGRIETVFTITLQPARQSDDAFVDALNVLVRRNIERRADSVRHSLIGRRRFTVDPVVAAMLRDDPETALVHIDRAIHPLVDSAPNHTHMQRVDYDDLGLKPSLYLFRGYGNDVLWRGRERTVNLSVDIPHTVLDLAIGRPLRDVVDHPHLRGDIVIRAVRRLTTTTEIVVNYDLVPLEGLLPPDILAGRTWHDGTPIDTRLF